MTVTELIQHLSDHDPNMEVYVTTKKENCNDIVNVDYELFACHGRYRGVYIEIGEEERSIFIKLGKMKKNLNQRKKKAWFAPMRFVRNIRQWSKRSYGRRSWQRNIQKICICGRTTQRAT